MLRLKFFNSHPRPNASSQWSKCTATPHASRVVLAYSAAVVSPRELVSLGPLTSVSIDRISITCERSYPSFFKVDRTAVSEGAAVWAEVARGSDKSSNTHKGRLWFIRIDSVFYNRT